MGAAEGGRTLGVLHMVVVGSLSYLVVDPQEGGTVAANLLDYLPLRKLIIIAVIELKLVKFAGVYHLSPRLLYILEILSMMSNKYKYNLFTRRTFQYVCFLIGVINLLSLVS